MFLFLHFHLYKSTNENAYCENEFVYLCRDFELLD